MKKTVTIAIAWLLILTMLSLNFAALADGLTLPAELKIIEEEAFYGDTSIEKVVVPEGATDIESRAFADSSLSEIELPSTLTTIADDAFENVDDLSVTAPEDSYAYEWAEEKGYIDESIPPVEDFEYTISNESVTIVKYVGTDTSIVIPSIIDGYAVTKIADFAFENRADISEIILPENLEMIGYRAFANCVSLTQIDIPDSVSVMYCDAFYNCSELISVSIPIGWKRVYYYKNENNYYNSPFRECKNLVEIVIPEGISALPSNAFDDMTSLTSIKLPSTLNCIDHHTFYGCTALKQIEIPNSVKSLKDESFGFCTSLRKIYIPKEIIEISTNTFNGCSSDLTIYGVSGSYAETYANENGIPFEADISVSPEEDFTYTINSDNTATVTGYAGAGGDVIMPTTLGGVPVVEIGENAFYGCSSLTSIVIPEGVTTISNFAFYGCTNLTDVILPDSLTVLADCVFLDCANLTNITMPSYLSELGYGTFCYCLKLAGISIPKGITTLGQEVFYSCTSLTSIIIPDSVTDIGSYAFADCNNLVSISIPDSVQNIDYGVFDGCSNSLTIYGVSGSYAETYADYMRIAFSTDNIPGTGIEFGSNESRTVGSAETTLTYQVNSGSDWVITSCPDWITLSAESGVSGDEVTLYIEANTGLDRTDYIRFESDTQYSDLIITQTGDAGASLADPVITWPSDDNAVVELVDVHIMWEPVEGADSYIFSLRDLTTDFLMCQHINTGADADTTEITLPYNYFAAGHTYRVAIGAVAEGRAAYETTTSWAERIFTVECTIDSNRAALGGTVVSSAGNPVEGATVSMYVTAGDYEDVKVGEAITGADGSWYCNGLRRGVTYNCIADSDNYFFANEYVTVTASGAENSVGTITALNSLENEVYEFSAYPTLWECSEDAESVETYLTAEGSWNASADADWITLSAVSGSESSAIGIEVGKNNSEEERIGIITFTSSNGDTAVVTIQQEASEELMVSAASTTIKELTTFSAGESVTYDGDLILKNTMILHGATVTVKGDLIVKAKGRLDLSDGGTITVSGDFIFDSNQSHSSRLNNGKIYVGGDVEIKRNFYASEKNEFHIIGSNTHVINMHDKWFDDDQYFNYFYIDGNGIEVLEVKEPFACAANGFQPGNWNILEQTGAEALSLTLLHVYNGTTEQDAPDYVKKYVQIGLARALAEHCNAGKKHPLMNIRYIKGEISDLEYYYVDENDKLSPYGIDINMFGHEDIKEGNVGFGTVTFYNYSTGEIYKFLVSSTPEQIYYAFLAFRDVVKDFVKDLATGGYDSMCEDMAKSIILDQLPQSLQHAYTVTKSLHDNKGKLEKLYKLAR